MKMRVMTRDEEPLMVMPGVELSGRTIALRFSVRYSNPDAIPVPVLRESITGVEQLVRETRRAILGVLGVDETEKSAILFDTLTTGSKLQDWLFRVVFGSDEEAAAAAESLRKRFGFEKMMEGKNVQNIVIAGILAYVICNVAKTFVPAGKSVPLIEASHAMVINAGRDLNISEERFLDILNAGIGNKTKAGKAAVQALAPAGLKPGTRVMVGSKEIPQEILAGLPDPDAIVDKKTPREMPYENVPVEIIACDKQNQQKGWAVALPKGYVGGGGVRLKALLADGVATGDLMFKEYARADVTVVVNDKGRPAHVIIRRVR